MTDCDSSRDLEVEVRVQPRASRDRLDGFRDGALRVRVGAPPERGKANASVLRLLAKTLGIARRRVTLVRGETFPHKTRPDRGHDRGEVSGRGGPSVPFLTSEAACEHSLLPATDYCTKALYAPKKVRQAGTRSFRAICRFARRRLHRRTAWRHIRRWTRRLAAGVEWLRPCPMCDWFQLIGRNDRGREVSPVLDRQGPRKPFVFLTPENGELVLLVNDVTYGNNRGSLDVEIKAD